MFRCRRSTSAGSGERVGTQGSPTFHRGRHCTWTLRWGRRGYRYETKEGFNPALVIDLVEATA